MRKALGLSIFITAMLATVPAFAQETDPAWSYSAGVEVASGLAYPDQAFISHRGSTLITDAEACRGSWCLSVWHAETGDAATRETDFLATYSFEAAGVAIDLTGGTYMVAGPDIWTGTVALTYPVSDSFSLTASYERMWHGYETGVTKLAGDHEAELSDRVLIDVGASIGFDTSIDDTVVAAEVGVSYALTDEVAVRAYVAPFRSGAGNGTVGGVSIRRSW